MAETGSNENRVVNNAANGPGSSTEYYRLSEGSSLDLSTDNSVDVKLSGNVGTVSGDGNTVLGTGATISTTTVQNLTPEVVSRALDSLDRGTDTVGRGLDTVDRTTTSAFAFSNRALNSADSAYAGGLGFGKDALEVVANFGSSTIQNANARADSALAAVERLAAVPTERNGSSAQDSRVTLYVVAALAALALLFGFGRRSSKS